MPQAFAVVRFYPDARHELFNETNREEVTRELLAWLDEASGQGNYSSRRRTGAVPGREAHAAWGEPAIVVANDGACPKAPLPWLLS
jgi:hypothetical protein